MGPAGSTNTILTPANPIFCLPLSQLNQVILVILPFAEDSPRNYFRDFGGWRNFCSEYLISV
ncbi:hypothetical protein FDUTEX481_00278 [Tolypothrix sp. PCC 7601]|nr:hypothetical protein FDUTEX481_00278 [Tolypothrix sp. PCC 7601]